MLALVIATALILLAGVIMAAHLSPRGAVAYLLAVALLGQAMIVASIGIAGIVVRSFAPATLLLIAVAWLVLAGLIAWQRRQTPVRWRARSMRAISIARATLRDPAVAIATLLVVGTLVWRTILAVRLPVVDYDGWSYHLVFVDVWLQNDALTLVPLRPWTSGYPAVMEMLTTWLAAFTHSDVLTGFSSLVPIPVGILATMGLARSIGSDRRAAVLAGLLFGMTPALVALAGTSYVDAASVASVVATWWLGLRVIRGERDRSAALLLGVAGGLALGTKGTNILLVTPILAVAAVVLLRDLFDRRRRRVGWVSLVAPLIAFCVPILVLGASWYLKNLAVYGNPFYPFATGPFPGPYRLDILSWAPPALEGRNTWEQVARSWVADWGLNRYAYNVRPGGLGRAWIAVLPLAAAGLLLVARRRNFALLAFVVFPVVVTFVTAPNPWYARYTLFVAALALALAAVTLTSLRPRFRVAMAVSLVALASISLTFVNIRPNIGLDRRSGRRQRARIPRLRVRPDDGRRSNVSLRADASGIA